MIYFYFIFFSNWEKSRKTLSTRANWEMVVKWVFEMKRLGKKAAHFPTCGTQSTWCSAVFLELKGTKDGSLLNDCVLQLHNTSPHQVLCAGNATWMYFVHCVSSRIAWHLHSCYAIIALRSVSINSNGVRCVQTSLLQCCCTDWTSPADQWPSAAGALWVCECVCVYVSLSLHCLAHLTSHLT